MDAKKRTDLCQCQQCQKFDECHAEESRLRVGSVAAQRANDFAEAGRIDGLRSRALDRAMDHLERCENYPRRVQIFSAAP